MARNREIKVTVLGDSKGGQRALAELNDSADRTDAKFDGLGGKLASFGKAAALGMAGAAVGVGLFLKSAVEAAEESRKVMAQTEAVIKSTGGVANVTASDVDKLASSLSAMSGVDDEVIASGQNLLLTFTNIRNETGKGNDIFNQATKSALDMSVALGTDLSAASMLVGKALNDPIGGMTALTRAGIQFTDSQKEQIRVLVESGDTLGAQKIILKELEVQFGGSAAAAASPMERLKVVIGNLQEELGAKLLPVVEKVATWLADNLPGALEKATAWVEQNWPRIKQTIVETMEKVQEKVQIAMDFIEGVIKVVTGVIDGDWRRVWDGIKLVLSAAWESMKGVVRDAIAAVVDIFLGMAESLIDIAARAFSWVPGIGPKLRNAADSVAEFRDNANDALRGIDKEVNVSINVTTYYKSIGLPSAYAEGAGQRASEGYYGPAFHGGGIVGGYGDVPILAQGGEGVFTRDQMAVLGKSMGGGGGGGSTDPQAIADAVAAALEPLVAQMRQAGMTINMSERADPLHLAREIAWAMG